MSDRNQIYIGCVADDFTGASDIGSFFAKGGLNVVLLNGIPSSGYKPREKVDVVVVALKSRSIEVELAVSKSMEAFRWLKDLGAAQLYFKYCSTFDSTPQGNIGPVIDKVLEEFDIRYTIISPALPVNGRTVRDGILYVNDIPLDQSSMKNHPLNPMWASGIKELMITQGKYIIYYMDTDHISSENSDSRSFIFDLLGSDQEHFYIVPDHYRECHAKRIIDIFGELPLITGSSGLAYEMSRRIISQINLAPYQFKYKPVTGKGAIISGSCSEQTKRQNEDFINRGESSIKLDPVKIIKGSQTLESVIREFGSSESENVLIYSCNTGITESVNRYSQLQKSRALEIFMSDLAKELLKAGIKRLIIAGGETSGAVIKSLGFESFLIGDEISPGVPVLIPENDESLRIILKSGNFGGNDFFTRALLGI